MAALQLLNIVCLVYLGWMCIQHLIDPSKE